MEMHSVEEEVVKYIAKNLVNSPDQVSVARRETGRSIVLELSVAPDDMGRVIGRSGRVANSIRTILRALPSDEGDHRRDRRRRVILEIE